MAEPEAKRVRLSPSPDGLSVPGSTETPPQSSASPVPTSLAPEPAYLRLLLRDPDGATRAVYLGSLDYELGGPRGDPLETEIETDSSPKYIELSPSLPSRVLRLRFEASSGFFRLSSARDDVRVLVAGRPLAPGTPAELRASSTPVRVGEDVCFYISRPVSPPRPALKYNLLARSALLLTKASLTTRQMARWICEAYPGFAAEYGNSAKLGYFAKALAPAISKDPEIVGSIFPHPQGRPGKYYKYTLVAQATKPPSG